MFVPALVGAFKLKSFGNVNNVVSPTNPSVIEQFSTQAQTFSFPGGVQPNQNLLATTNGWGDLGQQAMPMQLLPFVGSGFALNGVYAVAGGDATVPSDTTGGSLIIGLYQNVFTENNSVITTQSFLINQVTVFISPGNTVNWSLAPQVTSNPGFAAGFNEPLQLSVVANLQGSSANSPLITLQQFEYQFIR